MTKRLLQTIAKEIQVTGYLDYRDFLQAIYDQAKARQTPYSYLQFAEDLGFSATNAIRLVIARKRLLSEKSAQTIIKSLDLRKEHRKYFIAMVLHINSRGAGLRDKHFHKMLEAKQASVVEDGDRQLMEYYTEWYYPVIRELVRLESFQSDMTWMTERLYPNVSSDKIKSAIKLLESIGLLDVDAKSGKIKISRQSPMLLPTDATAGHLSITNYHQAMLDVAREAVTKVPAEQREMNALTINISAETFSELKDKIRDFCAEVMTKEATPQSRTCVAQLNVQLFTLTKPDDSES